MNEREETRDSNLETINEMIATSKEAIETIKRGMRHFDFHDQIKACKTLTRLTEDIRRLIRLKIAVKRETKNEDKE